MLYSLIFYKKFAKYSTKIFILIHIQILKITGYAQLTMLHLYLLALASGVLFPAALPNEIFLLGNPILGFICLIPLFLAISECGSPGKAAGVTALFGGVSTALANYWLMFFKDYAFLTIGTVTAAYTVLYAVFGGFLWKFSRPSPYRPFLIAAFWTVYEFIKSTGYLAYPWGLIVYPINTWLPLLQVADIAGIWPLSFLMALFNALGVETLGYLKSPGKGKKSPFVRELVFTFSLTGIFLLYGIYRINTPLPESARLSVVLVQQDADPWADDGNETALLRAQELSRQGVASIDGKADLVVWSESSLPRPFDTNRARFLRYPAEDPFIPFLQDLGAPLLTGNPVLKNREPRQIQNGAILLDNSAKIIDTYGKRHPVPMVEHVPFWEFEPVRNFFRDVIGLGSIWDLGDRDTIFSIPAADDTTVTFGAPICFEDAFPYLCRRFVIKGADLLINLTNDAWSRTNSAQVQHFVVARFRSIELKRVLIRSTNAGLTAVIGPFGEISASLDMFSPAYLSHQVSVIKEASFTPYTLFGDYFPVSLAVFLIFFLLFTGRKKQAPSLRREGI
jgi:apolipoprotein N-acyltransferase